MTSLVTRLRTGVAVAAALALFSAPGARAGSTDPVLVIGQATCGGGSPARLVDLLGSWGFDDVLQIDYPLTVVVYQGSTFVRLRTGQPAVAGSFAGLSDGLAAGEVAALEGAGSPTASASIVRFASHEMTLALPPVFAAGDLEVILYVSLPGEGLFLSNAAIAVRDS